MTGSSGCATRSTADAATSRPPTDYVFLGSLVLGAMDFLANSILKRLFARIDYRYDVNLRAERVTAGVAADSGRGRALVNSRRVHCACRACGQIQWRFRFMNAQSVFSPIDMRHNEATRRRCPHELPLRARVLRLASAAFAVCAALIALPAAAQYPNKPVKMVVPFIAGSSPDVLARMVGERLTAKLGQPVVIDNKGGAGGNVGAEFAAKQPADGYTLMLATSSHLVNPSLYSKVGYDPVRDFVPVALLIRMASLLVVPLDSPAKNVNELIALAKARPGQLNFGSGGNGSQAHLAGAMFKSTAGLDIVHVPYRGAPEIITSMLSGSTQLAFPTFSTTLPQVKAGKLRPLAVTGAARNPLLPEVPTLREAMPDGFDLAAWFGIWAPAGTPADIVKKLNADITAVLSDPEFRAKLAADGSEVFPGGTPDEFAGFVKSETAKWTKIVKDSGAKVE